MTDRPGTRAATAGLFARYLEIIEAQTNDDLADHRYLSLENLAWMCRQGLTDRETLPLDKLSRWLGCVQGCLGMRGLVDFDVERDISRPEFHAGYRVDGIVVPGSVERAIPSGPESE